MSGKVRIFDYDNFRTYLKDVYFQGKTQDLKYSFRFFARAAGYKSPSILKEIIEGKKNLSLNGIARFAKALKLNQQETSFFRSLVLLGQSTTAEEKLKHVREVTRSRAYKKVHPLADSQYLYFKHWYFSAVREIVALPGFKEDPHWIAKNIVPAISPLEARRAVEGLLKLGLLIRDDRGKLIQAESNITTPDEVSSTYVGNWHKEYLKRAAESIDSVPRERRDISAVYFTFSNENLRVLKDLFHKFRRDVLEIADQQENKNAVYQMNMQLFPIAKSDGEDS